MKREFASLTPPEALHVAIFIEERNATIYHQFAELFAEFHDPDSLEIAGAFWDMANEERQHGTLLQSRYFDRYGNRPCAITEEDIRDFIEVPRLENGEVFSVRQLKNSRSPRELALQVAVASEQGAQRYYTRLSEMTEDTELRALYRELADFETDHTDWLQRKMDEARRAASDTKLD
jgi:rubrerythrin